MHQRARNADDDDDGDRCVCAALGDDRRDRLRCVRAKHRRGRAKPQALARARAAADRAASTTARRQRCAAAPSSSSRALLVVRMVTSAPATPRAAALVPAGRTGRRRRRAFPSIRGATTGASTSAARWRMSPPGSRVVTAAARSVAMARRATSRSPPTYGDHDRGWQQPEPECSRSAATSSPAGTRARDRHERAVPGRQVSPRGPALGRLAPQWTARAGPRHATSVPSGTESAVRPARAQPAPPRRL